MKIIKLDAINSTNEYLKKYIKENFIKTTYVAYTFNQTNGKGQRGKTWDSEQGKNLAFSLCLFPENVKAKDQFSFNMIVSLFLFNILKSLKIPDLKIKWPNDILSGGKKICGILNEFKVRGDSVENIIIGFGLNINQENFDNLPNASSLKLINKITYDLNNLTALIIQSLKRYDYLNPKSELELKKINNNYNRNLYKLNNFSNFKDSEKKIFQGKIISVDKDGLLKMRLKNGNIENYNFQEIQMVLN